MPPVHRSQAPRAVPFGSCAGGGWRLRGFRLRDPPQALCRKSGHANVRTTVLVEGFRWVPARQSCRVTHRCRQSLQQLQRRSSQCCSADEWTSMLWQSACGSIEVQHVFNSALLFLLTPQPAGSACLVTRRFTHQYSIDAPAPSHASRTEESSWEPHPAAAAAVRQCPRCAPAVG